jgi:metal-responsive CopG/Arc/MetJ family transcriptional regulator
MADISLFKDISMDKYPRLTFRLNQALLTKVNNLSLSRHRTRGAIIREALEMYYRVYNPIKSNESISKPHRDTSL